MIIVRAIPYHDFKEKIKITKEHKEAFIVEDLKDFIYIVEDDKRGKRNGD